MAPSPTSACANIAQFMPTGDTTQGRAAAIYCNILELHLPRSHGPSSSGITPTVMDEKKPSSASIDEAHSGSATRSDSALPRCKRLSIRPGSDGPRHRAPARCPLIPQVPRGANPTDAGTIGWRFYAIRSCIDRSRKNLDICIPSAPYFRQPIVPNNDQVSELSEMFRNPPIAKQVDGIIDIE